MASNRALDEVAEALHQSGEAALRSSSPGQPAHTPNAARTSPRKRSAPERDAGSRKRTPTGAAATPNDDAPSATYARQEAAVLNGVVEILDRAVDATRTMELSLTRPASPNFTED